jgi:hypothetical protein
MQMTRSRTIVLLGVVALGVASLTAAKATPAPAHPQHKHRAVCGPASDHQARCHARVVTLDDGVRPLASTSPPSGSYGPADLASAYALPAPSSGAGAGQTVAIVDAYDNPNAASDLAAYRAQYGLPACTASTGCFRKLNQAGATSPMPSADVGWGQEIDLDLEMVSAACPSCHIVLVEANSSTFGNLGTAENTAAGLANAISNSYGGSEWSSETAYDAYYNHPGVAITVSSGDNGYGVEYPAASAHVTAVGGTSLSRAGSTRGWTETAWSGAGSGCSGYVTKPAWQTDSGCARRSVADVSADADPNTGVAVYDSYGSSGANWYQFGGTSVASPIIASVYALGGATATLNYGSYPYSHRSALFDVVGGTNGSCSPSYLCTAITGYDGPTGLGTPNGTVAFGGSATTPTTTTSTTSTTTTAPTTTTSVHVTTTTAPTTTTLAPPTQLVVNSGFETASFSPWVAGGGAPAPAIVYGAGHSGNYSALLGSAGPPEPYGDSWVYQTITIPSTVSKATLSFWYWASTTDTVTYDWQQAQIRNSSGSTLVPLFKTASNARTWTKFTYDLSSYRGSTIQLWFDVHQDGYGDPTAMYLDDVTVATS